MNVCLHEKLYENIKMIYQKLKKKIAVILRTLFVEILSYKGAIEGVASIHLPKPDFSLSRQTSELSVFTLFTSCSSAMSWAPSNFGAPTNKETSWPRPFDILSLSLKEESKCMEDTCPFPVIFIGSQPFFPLLISISPLCVFLFWIHSLFALSICLKCLKGETQYWLEMNFLLHSDLFVLDWFVSLPFLLTYDAVMLAKNVKSCIIYEICIKEICYSITNKILIQFLEPVVYLSFIQIVTNSLQVFLYRISSGTDVINCCYNYSTITIV